MIFVIKHSDSVGPGWLLDLLRDSQTGSHVPFQILRPDTGQNFPADSPSHLIVLGGAMNTHEEKKFPWLKKKKKFI